MRSSKARRLTPTDDADPLGQQPRAPGRLRAAVSDRQGSSSRRFNARQDGATIIITTGGVVSTIDDLTVESVGRSLGIDNDHELPEMLEALRGWIGEEPQGVRRRTARTGGTSVLFPSRRRQPHGVFASATPPPRYPSACRQLLPLLPLGPGERPLRRSAVAKDGRRSVDGSRRLAVSAPRLRQLPPTQSGDDRVSLTASARSPRSWLPKPACCPASRGLR